VHSRGWKLRGDIPKLILRHMTLIEYRWNCVVEVKQPSHFPIVFRNIMVTYGIFDMPKQLKIVDEKGYVHLYSYFKPPKEQRKREKKRGFWSWYKFDEKRLAYEEETEIVNRIWSKYPLGPVKVRKISSEKAKAFPVGGISTLRLWRDQVFPLTSLNDLKKLKNKIKDSYNGFNVLNDITLYDGEIESRSDEKDTEKMNVIESDMKGRDQESDNLSETESLII